MSDKYVFLIFPGIGVALLLVALWLWLRTKRFVVESLSTQGTVVRLAEISDSDGTTYAPVVRFTTRDGVRSEFTDSVSSRPAGYSVGEQVEVLYHYRDHKRARLASSFRLYFAPGVLGFVGLLFAGAGFIVLYFLL